METWTDIPGFEGYYQVSNLQRIKSLNRSFIMERDIFDRWSLTWHKKTCTITIKERILKQHYDGQYLRVGLNKNGEKYPTSVHRIVGINLEWVTRSENLIHAYENGLVNGKKSKLCIK